VLNKLLERLQALEETARQIRDKARGRTAAKLDGLVLAQTLVAVDAAAKKLAALEKKLQPALFDEDKSA
jgi:hypothetical protein